MIGIYAVKNNINGMMYIGQSKNIKQRWYRHRGSHTEKTILSREMDKYGKDNFSFIVLQECEIDELDDLERYYISKYNTIYPNGYNIEDGGKHGASFGELSQNAILSEEEVYNIREDYKNLVNVNEAYAKVADKMTINGFKSIWSGRSWVKVHMDVYTEETRKWHRMNFDRITNHHRIISDEEVIAIRDIRNEGKVSRGEAKELFPHINNNTFNDIWYNHTFKNIQSDKPVVKTDKMLRKPTDQYGANNPYSKYSVEDVKTIRSRRDNGEKMKDVYKDYKNRTHLTSFSNIWKGKSYTNI